MEPNKKQYGLLLPKRDHGIVTSVVKKPAAFNSDSDEESSTVDWMSKTAKKEAYGSGKSRQTKADIDRVLKDDPTAYQYDEVYDEMKKKKDEVIAAKKNDKTPKYMTLLLKQAERRKREDERRKERQIQKEREAEGDEFADKEVFITSSYKKKLEELRKMDEEDKRMERLEKIGDVTKQCDLGGFYRHLYESMNSDTHSVPENSESKPPSATTDTKSKFREFDKNKTRNIRKRAMSSDDENNTRSESQANIPDNKGKTLTKEYLESSKTGTSKNECISLEPSITESEPSEPKQVKIVPHSDEENNDSENDDESDAKSDNEKSDKENEDEKKKILPEKKINIWIKRTVGEVFDAAFLRYEERKSSRAITC